MRAFGLLRATLCSVVSLLVACDGPTDSRSSRADEIAVTRQGIVGGALDTSAHDATVAVMLATGGQIVGTCTGALIAIDPIRDAAYVLTAAHCVTDYFSTAVEVRVGTDWSAASLTMPVAATSVHPDYHSWDVGSGYDFAVITVRDLPAGLPTPYTIPGVGGDGLAVGSSVTIKGYGNTISYGNPDGETTQRKTIDLPVMAETEIALTYDQQNGGPCDGDSGGPAIVGNLVVGVTSYGYSPDGQTETCSSRGVSARVSSGRAFIQAIVEGQPPPPPEVCRACRADAADGEFCRAKSYACGADPDCNSLYQCLRAPGADRAACLEQFPNGQGPLQDGLDCPCVDVCATECSGKPVCQGTPKCGLDLGAANSHRECIEAQCCAELDAAAANGLGFRCVTEDPPPPGCASNDAFHAYQACADLRCGGDGSSSSGASSSSSSSSSSSGSDRDDDAEDGDDDAGEGAEGPSKSGGSNPEGGGACSTTPGVAFGSESVAALSVLVLLLARLRRAQ